MKKGLLTLVLLVSVVVAFAQQPVTGSKSGPFLTNKILDNWFISIGGGAQIYISGYDKQAAFGDRIAPALDFSIGKWVTPSVGFRVQAAGIQAKGITNALGIYREGSPDADILYTKKFNVLNVHGDFLLNFSNLVAGYKEDRFYQAVPFIGVGWAHGSKSGITATTDEVSFNGGLVNIFRISSDLDFNVELRSMFVHERFDGTVGNIRGEAMASATVGFTYKFSKRGFDRPEPPIVPDYTPYNKKISELEKSILAKEAEAKRLANELKAEQSKPKEVRVTNTEVYIPSLAIFFEIGRSELSEKELINLANIAVVIKKAPGKKYQILGSADKATGTKKLNQALSEKRAKKVYDVLVNKFGVDAAQLTVVAKGSENEPFGKPFLNRVAIIEN